MVFSNCGISCSVLVAVLAAVLWAFLFYVENQSIPNEDRINRMSSEAEVNTEKMQAANKSCFVVGYTGEVGKELVRELLTRKTFSKVTLIGRRVVNYTDDLYKDAEQVTVDFDNLDAHADAFKDVDVGFCCLGTTRGKSGKEGFIKVDHDYVMKTAELAKAGGCSHFSMVSSASTNKNSVFLYPKVKGQVEEELKEMNFPRLSIFKPAFLLCERTERRLGEIFVQIITRPITYFFPTAISVPTKSVAKSMVNSAIAPQENAIDIYENKAIHKLAGDNS